SLRELGYVEGQNLSMEYRWSAGNVERLRANAAELVRLGVDVIVTGGPVATRAAQDMTRTIPTGMARDVDPVGDGCVASLGRPGGEVRATEEAGGGLSLGGQALEVRGRDEFEGAFAAARTGRADGLIVLAFPPGPAEDRTRLVALAAQSRLPTIYWQRAFVEA